MKKHISGITTHRGITFVGLKNKLHIYNDCTFSMKPYNNITKHKTTNIPFIRGFFKLFNAMKMASPTLIGKISIFFICLSILFFTIGLFKGENISQTQTGLTSIIINVLIIVGIIVYSRIISEKHGLEHKLIWLYNKGYNINLESVRNAPKAIPRCGGTFLGIILFFSIIWNFTGLSALWLWLIIPSIGFELFLLADKGKWYSKIIFFPGWCVQQITTSNGLSDYIVQRHIDAFKIFINCEENHSQKCS